MSVLDDAMSLLSTRLPGFRVSTMGEYPTRREQGGFFCCIEQRPRGGAFLGEGHSLAQAVRRAAGLALERDDNAAAGTDRDGGGGE